MAGGAPTNATTKATHPRVKHPTGTLGTNANADGLCDHEEAVVCLDEVEDGKSDYRQGRKAKFRADIGVGLLRRKEEDD